MKVKCIQLNRACLDHGFKVGESYSVVKHEGTLSVKSRNNPNSYIWLADRHGNTLFHAKCFERIPDEVRKRAFGI